MLTDIEVAGIYSLPKRQREDIIAKRIELRNLYSSAAGIRQLCDIVRSGHVLSQIGSDPDSVVQHDFAISMLDGIGLFDEANLESIIRYLLSLPVFPKRVQEEGEKEDV